MSGAEGTPFQIQRDRDRLLAFSMGPDKLAGTADDISSMRSRVWHDAPLTLERLNDVVLSPSGTREQVDQWSTDQTSGEHRQVVERTHRLESTALGLVFGRSCRHSAAVAARGDVDERARVAWESGRACAARGDMEGAAVHADEAGRLAPACRDPIVAAACFELLGDVSIRRGQVEQARCHLGSAKELYRRHAEIVGEANVELSLAELSARMGDRETAAVHFGVAAERYERAGRAKGQAAALSGLAFLEAIRGAQGLAEEHSDRAVRLVEDLDDQEAIATARLTRAQVRLSRDPMVARAELVEVLRTYEGLSDGMGVANTHRWLMEAAARLQDVPSTMIHFRAALRAYRAIESHWGETLCWSFVADLLLGFDDVTGAELAMAAGCSLALKAGAMAGAAKLCAGRARLMVSRGAIDEGLALLERAAQIAATSGAAGVQVEIHPNVEQTRGALDGCRRVRDSLSQSALLLLEILSLLEHPDSCVATARPAFERMWHLLGHTAERSPFEEALAELRRSRLLAAVDGPQPSVEAPTLRLAPHLRDWSRALVSTERAVRVMDAVGSAWAAEFLRDAQTPHSRTVRAGIGAAVYFKRLERFVEAFQLLEATLQVAKTTGETLRVVPHLYMVALASGDTGLMARVEELEASGVLSVS
jgi:tetratricopeptide (TPR) repeat protein